MPWDDLLEYDVDAVLALAEHVDIDDENYENENAKTKTPKKFKNEFSFPRSNPIDALAKSVLKCDIRAEPNVSDAENVVLMTHLCKILQVAFERATLQKSDLYVGGDGNEDESEKNTLLRLERENETLREKLNEQRREILVLSEPTS